MHFSTLALVLLPVSLAAPAVFLEPRDDPWFRLSVQTGGSEPSWVELDSVSTYIAQDHRAQREPDNKFTVYMNDEGNHRDFNNMEEAQAAVCNSKDAAGDRAACLAATWREIAHPRRA